MTRPMLRLAKSLLLALTLALALAACAAADDGGGLTPDELAQLPDESDHDHAGLAGVVETPEDDAANFDTTDVEPLDEDGGITATAAGGVIYAQPLLKAGLHPRASDGLRAAGVAAWRITQTIGNAPASAGTHAQDGTVDGKAYCAATDISVTNLTNAQIQNLLDKLAKVGFAAWFRWPGHDGWPASEARHIHAVYANARMKTALRSQVRSWLAGRNGLASNTTYTFFTWPAASKLVVETRYAQSAHGTTNAGTPCVVGGAYCGQDRIAGNADWLYRCTAGGNATLIKKCANGCAVNSGTDDACK